LTEPSSVKCPIGQHRGRPPSCPNRRAIRQSGGNQWSPSLRKIPPTRRGVTWKFDSTLPPLWPRPRERERRLVRVPAHADRQCLSGTRREPHVEPRAVHRGAPAAARHARRLMLAVGTHLDRHGSRAPQLGRFQNSPAWLARQINGPGGRDACNERTRRARQPTNSRQRSNEGRRLRLTWQIAR